MINKKATSTFNINIGMFNQQMLYLVPDMLIDVNNSDRYIVGKSSLTSNHEPMVNQRSPAMNLQYPGLSTTKDLPIHKGIDSNGRFGSAFESRTGVPRVTLPWEPDRMASTMKYGLLVGPQRFRACNATLMTKCMTYCDVDLTGYVCMHAYEVWMPMCACGNVRIGRWYIALMVRNWIYNWCCLDTHFDLVFHAMSDPQKLRNFVHKWGSPNTPKHMILMSQ